MRILKNISTGVKLLSICYLFILTGMMESNNISFRSSIIQASVIAFVVVTLEVVVRHAEKKFVNDEEG